MSLLSNYDSFLGNAAQLVCFVCGQSMNFVDSIVVYSQNGSGGKRVCHQCFDDKCHVWPDGRPEYRYWQILSIERKKTYGQKNIMRYVLKDSGEQKFFCFCRSGFVWFGCPMVDVFWVACYEKKEVMGALF